MALPSIKDNITTTLQEFKVEAFGVASENEEYIANLFGIEDLVGGLTGVLDFIGEFADAIFKFLEELFEMFELPDFDLSSILSMVLGMIGGGMANGSLQTRDDLSRIADGLCPGGSSDELKATSIMKRFALSAVVLAMGCSGNTNAFSTLLNMNYGNNAKDVNVPEPEYLDSEGLYVNLVTDWISNNKQITKANTINNLRQEARNEVDKTFYPLIGTIIPNIQNGKVTDYLSDMYNTGLVTKAVNSDSNLKGKVIKSYDKNYNATEQPTSVLREIENYTSKFDGSNDSSQLTQEDLRTNSNLKKAYQVAVRTKQPSSFNPNDDIGQIDDSVLNLF